MLYSVDCSHFHLSPAEQYSTHVIMNNGVGVSLWDNGLIQEEVPHIGTCPLHTDPQGAPRLHQ